MFQKIRYRLLLSYLIVFASILIVFALAVRILFARSLTQQLNEKLITLGQAAAANAEDEGHLKIGDDAAEDLIGKNQALQWFDSSGHLIAQRGKFVLTVPPVQNDIQIQSGAISIQGITLPIITNDNKRLIGYVRVSQSLAEIDENLYKLDLGLAGGIVMALVLSGIGGVWLTRQAMQPIESSFQRLKQFTADASHELRSPLMAIKSNAAVALKYSEGMRPLDVEKFQAIASATNQMTRLTEDLLFLTRTDKVPERERELVNLTSLLADLVGLYKPQAEAKQIALNPQLTETFYLLGDPVQLTRLFTNLLENAIHYTSARGVVEIKISRIAAYLDIIVRDTGVGIAPEQIEQIFERFWRAEQSRSYWSGGAGLGLSIAQAIAENHGGSISVTSELGVGSCFTVRLPAST